MEKGAERGEEGMAGGSESGGKGVGQKAEKIIKIRRRLKAAKELKGQV